MAMAFPGCAPDVTPFGIDIAGMGIGDGWKHGQDKEYEGSSHYSHPVQVRS
jgi:hypothetical protein